MRLRQIICFALPALLSIAARASAQNLFVSNGYRSGDSMQPTISSIAPNGSVSVFAPGDPAFGDRGLAFDAAGNLYAATYQGTTIEKYAPSGADLGVFVNINPSDPEGIVFDAQGDLYVASNPGNVMEYSPKGVLLRNLGLGSTFGLALDASGALYVSSLQGVIYKVDASGSTIFANTGIVSYGLAFGPDGFLYAANRDAGTVSKISPSGSVSTFVSGLNGPWGLAFSGSDLYVSEFGTNANGAAFAGSTIRKISPDGTSTLFATGLNRPTFLAFQPAPEPSPLAAFAAGCCLLGGMALRIRLRAA